ncbi:MAG: helix-turn-helix transcriptional regulator [Clostridia bacterium]|nr:helix-turn-helix transcriptional regulator [Clostridia bacterium]
MGFGETLKKLLEEQKITQQTIANYVGVSQRAVSKWINKQSEPTESAIVKCAKFFSITTDYMLGLEDEFGKKDYSEEFQYTDGTHNITHKRRK